ncbi:MAG: serine/threonine-protein kinase [Planctomycetota bacterium]
MSDLGPQERDPFSTVPRDGGVYSGYRLEELVSRGPFSEVWRARGLDGEPAALKFARGELGARMLEEETRISRQLALRCRGSIVEVRAHYDERHPERTGDRPYLVMPWIAGGTLRDRLRALRGADDRARAARLFLLLCKAVSNVHEAGVVHGDLKPENVLLAESAHQPDPYTPRLVDFGLASQLRTARLGQSLRQSLKTEDEGLVGGTLAYMPPEAVKGGEATRQGDVYALGVMLHEVLLGRRPDKATSPEQLRSQLPEELVEVLLKALAFEPGDRYWSARPLHDELWKHRQELTRTGASRVGHALKRFALRGAAAYFVALRYLAVLCLLGTYLSILVATLVTTLREGPVGLLMLLTFLPLVLLHGVIRWEGPESPEEAASRAAGNVFNVFGDKRRR